MRTTRVLIKWKYSALFVLSWTTTSFTGFAKAQPPPPSRETVPVQVDLGITTLALWGAGASPEEIGKNSQDSMLTVFVPHPGKGNGTAVVIAPGGAYVGLASNLEGRQVADWFAARGVTAFVLKYRLGAANPYPVPLLDAHRAIRLVRSLSKNYHLSANRVGIMGFSAGGHLAAMEATSFDDGKPSANDPVDRFSDRPDFLILGYPWLNAMQPNNRNLITYCSVLPSLRASDCKDWEQKYTPALHVTANTPSTFLYSTSDDALVPVQASVDFYSALARAGVPVEMHLFRHGAHGSGLGEGDAALDMWPRLLEVWLRTQGWLMPEPVASGAGKEETPNAPTRPSMRDRNL
jgi:acetyl esterase/lipase